VPVYMGIPIDSSQSCRSLLLKFRRDFSKNDEGV
jgi:hypothetical protein